jgi:Type II restriction endonuclease EcoO109I
MLGKGKDMNEMRISEVQDYVHEHICEFHHAKLDGLNVLRLDSILKRKNPYLYKAKNMLTSEMIVRSCIDAHISSNEETLFGNWLEGLAIYINSKVYGGWKSGITGIDLEFDDDTVRTIVTIKSGPNWGNSSQINKMKEDFVTAKRTLRTSNSRMNIVAVNGCCYGKDKNPDKGEYFKYCGQSFWQTISGNEALYLDIIEPLGFEAKKNNDEYEALLANVINRFTREFSEVFCKPSGEIDWEKLVKFNSGKGNS